jgi:Arylsulfotransferase (ASST)
MKPSLGILALFVALAGVAILGAPLPGQSAQADPKKKEEPAKQPKAALVLNDPKAFKGYTLFSPMNSGTSYLIDTEGRVVHSWKGAGGPAMSAYLQANGNLFRPTSGGAGKGKGGIAGAGGQLQEIAWDGTVVWEYKFDLEKFMPHHDAIKLPSGNYLAIVSISKSAEEAAAAGRKGGALMCDSLLEIKPAGKSGGEIVWQWNTWDHLVQDADPDKASFGKIAESPGLLDINFSGGGFGKGNPKDGKGDPKGGKGGPGFGGKGGTDWNHCNGLDYNAELDQIIISVHSFSEFWILDHSTTTAEAASHKGGKQGKGGDLIYRWGNPRAYGGKAEDRQLYMQHNAQWIRKGLSGAGHILVFNNGPNRPDGTYSSVDEIVPPVDAKGAYTYTAGAAYGPAKAHWSYTAEKKNDFFAQNISGAQRLPNGNTLICSGPSGTIFEVTDKNEVVWKYINPGGGPGGGPGGKGPFGDKKGPGKDFEQKDFDGKGFGGKKDGFPPGGKGGPGGGGGGLFRALRYAPDHPAFVGKELKPGNTLEELLQQGSKGKE